MTVTSRLAADYLRKAVSVSLVWLKDLKSAIKSRETFKAYIKTRDSDDNGGWSWKNEDLLPTPPEDRNWHARNYIFFYSSLAMDNWTLGSAMVGVGLAWWQATVAIFIGEVLRSVAAALNSRCAEVYHIGFPVVSRSVFGMYGSYYPVTARAVLAAVYYALKMYVGSAFVVNILHAVFGSSFTSIPNKLPENLGFTTQQMLAFFLFWLLHVPFVFLRPNQLKWLFTIKMIIMAMTMTGLFIFCMVNTKGNLGNGVLRPKIPVSSTAWLYLYAINSVLGAHSTLTANQPDYSRWSARLWSSIWTQLIFWPLSVTIATTFGILSTASINNAWDMELWNQWDLLNAILDRYPTSAVRFAVFMCAACWSILALGTNVAANMIPLGSDLAMLFPRYMNMARGQALGLILSWVVCPWYIYSSATVFTKFLSGYGLFMGGVTGVMVADYILVRGNLFVKSLYDGSRANPHYYFIRGWNVQGILAYICGMAPGFPGFCGNLGVHVSTSARELGYLGWLLAFTISLLVYISLCLVWPTQAQTAVKVGDLSYERMAVSGAETRHCDVGTININTKDADKAAYKARPNPDSIS